MKISLKTLFSVFAFVFMLFSTVTAIGVNSNPTFPAYDQSLNKKPLHHSCSCSGVFGGSASATCRDACNCTCVSGFFSCSCACDCSGENHASVPVLNPTRVIYVTPEQYKNWKELGDILLSDNSEKGKNAYEEVVSMFNLLKKEDYKTYEDKIPTVMASLKSQSDEVKKKINALCEKNHSEVRI